MSCNPDLDRGEPDAPGRPRPTYERERTEVRVAADGSVVYTETPLGGGTVHVRLIEPDGAARERVRSDGP